jgi:hypothetical protein
MNAINNMTLFDFVGDDIWTVSNKKGGSRRSDYEVKLTLSEKSENANKGQRVTLTLRGKAYDATRKYNRVWVSSFNKLGNENVIILKVSEATDAPGSYALSRASKSDGSTNIQFVAPKCDLEQYANWHGGFYKLKPLADDVFYIQLSDREA